MITIKSHGFKFSRPEANIVFDVSYFKNPWRDEKIRNEKSAKRRNEMIMYYMNDQEGFQVFIDKIMGLLSYYILFHPNENITIAFCCSGVSFNFAFTPIAMFFQAFKWGNRL